MCIAAWVWDAHPVYRLLLLFNRDEEHDRPTEAVGWWGEREKRMLGGKDKLGGGTWLGCSKDGRVAFLTNVRLPDSLPYAKSRGVLPVRFLESSKSPIEFAEEIAQEADQYNGFNLILTDLRSRTMIYVSNRPKGEPVRIQTVSPGIHVLSNASLDTPWPKAQRLKEKFTELFLKHGHEEVIAEKVIEELMKDTVKADRDQVPNTGVDPKLEFAYSSIFVEVETPKGRYGTRSMSAISVKVNEEVEFYDRYLENGAWKEQMLHYQIENCSGDCAA